MKRYIVNPDGTIKWLDKKSEDPTIKIGDGKKDKPASGWKKLTPKNKAHGGKISKYYKGGGNVITGRD